MGRVHMAITRQVKPGKEAEFDAALRIFAQNSLGAPGVTGVLLLGPVPGSSSNEYGILRSFDSDAARTAFYQSKLFADWEAESDHLVTGPAIFRDVHGMEAFFRDKQNPPPLRWKMAVVTWLGVFPVSVLWNAGLSPLFAYIRVHPIAGSAISSALIVVSLTWFIMPLLTKLFARWLRREPQLT